MDDDRFRIAYEKSINTFYDKKTIGILGEKKLHSFLKHYFEPDDTFHECKINGFIADISKDEQIYEIQTSSFNVLRNKLDCFLKEHKVTLIYPIPYIKWLYWIDEENGEITKKRKSPKVGSFAEAFYELYKIKMFLKNENLSICLILIDMEEYRLLNGWSTDKKKGSTRYERIPLKIVEKITLSCAKDYRMLIPTDIETPFTTKQLAKCLGVNLRRAQLMLNILNHMQVVYRCGRCKNAYLYEITNYS